MALTIRQAAALGSLWAQSVLRDAAKEQAVPDRPSGAGVWCHSCQMDVPSDGGHFGSRAHLVKMGAVET